MKIFFKLIYLSMVIFFIWVVYNFAFGYASKHWVYTPGKVNFNRIESRNGKLYSTGKGGQGININIGGSITDFEYEYEYEYEVNNIPYKSSRISYFETEKIFNRAGETISVYYFSLFPFFSVIYKGIHLDMAPIIIFFIILLFFVLMAAREQDIKNINYNYHNKKQKRKR